MLQVNTTKFCFRIRTRQGLLVESLLIHARDETDAERKLRQMYINCEVLACSVHYGNPKAVPMSSKDVVTLVTK